MLNSAIWVLGLENQVRMFFFVAPDDSKYVIESWPPPVSDSESSIGIFSDVEFNFISRRTIDTSMRIVLTYQ